MIAILTSCAGLGDYSINLPGKLQVDRINGDTIVISLIDEESGIGSTIVPTKVTGVGWSKEYIIAKQVDEKEGYWIVKVSTVETIGPLDHEDFIKKKKELDISDNVKLKRLDHYGRDR